MHEAPSALASFHREQRREAAPCLLFLGLPTPPTVLAGSFPLASLALPALGTPECQHVDCQDAEVELLPGVWMCMEPLPHVQAGVGCAVGCFCARSAPRLPLSPPQPDTCFLCTQTLWTLRGLSSAVGGSLHEEQGGKNLVWQMS